MQKLEKCHPIKSIMLKKWHHNKLKNTFKLSYRWGVV
ncbi:MAG: hypothetical protein ACI9SG_001369 [Maribacter sp.]